MHPRRTSRHASAHEAFSHAELQLELLLQHRDQLTPLKRQSPAMRALAQLIAHRHRLVGDNVRLTHRLTTTLNNDFPHGLPWVHEKDPAIFCDFRAPWPTLKAVPLACRSTLACFFRAQHGRYADVIDQRIQAIKSATPLTTDEGVIVPNALLVQALVTQLRVILPAIEDFDHVMAPCAQSHPACPWFDALPGAGVQMAS